jgi:tetratricopeptide (TPR) repeat protein
VGVLSRPNRDPGNARLAAHYGRCLADYALAKEIDEDEARRARGEAEFQTRRALKLASDNVEVNKVRAEVATRLGDQDYAQNRIEEARKKYEEALAIYRALAEKNPEAYRAEIERSLELLGTVNAN